MSSGHENRHVNARTEKTLERLKSAPHSIEAEQSVLGALMLDNALWDIVTDIIDENDFFSRHHRLIYREMQSLISRAQPVDLLTLYDSLKHKKLDEQVGGFAYLAELSKNTPTTANIVAYAQIVRERAVVREMIAVGNKIVDAGMDTQGRGSEELLDYAEGLVFQIAEKREQSTGTTYSIARALEVTVNRIEELYNSPHGGVTGIDTGFRALNSRTSGLQNADLVIIAARPSMGKTTLAMNICENAAMLQDKPVMIFSLEMPAEQLTMRMLSSQSRVPLTKIRSGQLDDEDWARLSSTMGMLLQKQNIFIDDASGLTPPELRSRARRMYKEHGGLSMIMIDYLQLMRVPEYDGNRTLEIAEISRSLKALAKELDVPVVALSQLNRALEQRADRRPVNSDLRESGSIEQDADLIMFIYRDEVYNDSSEDKGTAEIIIGKQRNGPIGRVRLAFNGQYSRFDNLDGPDADTFDF